jgi:hypothetical protein
MMNGKIDQLVGSMVRPIAGSLLVAGALFCSGLMSGHAQTVDASGFGFESQTGSSYEVEATGDLKEWGRIKTYNGTGTMIRFEDERDQVFPQIYYRVRVVE